jgi:hypothetical protein
MSLIVLNGEYYGPQKQYLVRIHSTICAKNLNKYSGNLIPKEELVQFQSLQCHIKVNYDFVNMLFSILDI